MQYAKFILDGLYLLVAFVTIFVFTKRGFIDSAFRCGRTIFAGLISYSVGPVISTALCEKWIHPVVINWVSGRIEKFLVSAAENLNLEGIIEELPFFVKQLLDGDSMAAQYGETIENFDDIAHEFSVSVSLPLATLLSNLIAYLLVFFVASLVLWILFKIIDGIFKLPVLNFINKTLGFVLGVFAAALMLGALTFGIGFFAGMIGSAEMIDQLEEASVFYRFFHGMEIYKLF